MSERLSVSANEYCVTVAKACVAQNVERSAAQDMARACCVLENDGVAALPRLVRALGAFADDAPAANWLVGEDRVDADGVRSLRDGAAVMDLHTAFSEVFLVCDEPVLMAGLASISGARMDVQIEGKWLPFNAREPRHADREMRYRLKCNDDPSSPAGPIVFRNPAWWRQIEDFAKGILVPATDATRADAGAGNTDND